MGRPNDWSCRDHPPLTPSQGGFFLTPVREAMGPATTLSRPIHCYLLPLPRERAGVRGERRDLLPLPRVRGERYYWLPLPREREQVVSGATAFTLAMVSHGDSFDLSGGGAAIDPSPQPSPRGRGS